MSLFYHNQIPASTTLLKFCLTIDVLVTYDTFGSSLLVVIYVFVALNISFLLSLSETITSQFTVSLVLYPYLYRLSIF